jgi:hypothetical protein
MGSIWLPVFTEEEKVKAKEMDLAAISEKEVYVRKADLVSLILKSDYDL